MCRNGNYTEWGIKSHHGYARERYRITPDFLVKVSPSLGDLGVLLEPTTVVAKAWDHIGRIGARAKWEPRTVLVTGAGPIGLLAALLGVQRGFDVHVLDQVTAGLKPDLVAALGATYHHGDIASTGFTPDIVIECTGVGQLVFDAMDDIGAERCALPDRRLVEGPLARHRRRRAQPAHGARKRRRFRLGKCQPEPLRSGRRGTRKGRPRMARPRRVEARYPRPLAGRLPAPARRRKSRSPVQLAQNNHTSGEGQPPVW